ncbi:bifunctional 4-hydroxy-2-oxoglutarate aldolase/2-dehydro-3-deoxy-phosphogluconate aldolase [Limnobacter sp.]|uniref:bifunctional 4-hydroxy-2-oxoglutarate aldolase/2-dehydro-3-deoxy-phosphogluconate aldolase n=1 Tax=Limnobacter sp. TaxID=2003368 RepID=UPI0035165BBC
MSPPLTPPHTTGESTHPWLSQGVLPVVVVNNPAQALAIAEGLLQGGIEQIEITLRTPAAIPAIRDIARQFPSMRVSAGTVLTPDQFEQAADAGASVFISPGLTETLAAHAKSKRYRWVPGVATASEMMRALELGFELLKFFPAMAAGGPKALAGIAAPLPVAKLVPTGGVSLQNIAEWRAIPAVQAVGGTWLTAGLEDETDVVDVVKRRAAQALAAWRGQVLV